MCVKVCVTMLACVIVGGLKRSLNFDNIILMCVSVWVMCVALIVCGLQRHNKKSKMCDCVLCVIFTNDATR